MNAPKRLRAGDSELTKFKRLWRDTFTEAQRDVWRSHFLSSLSQADIRALVQRELGIRLTYDDQLKQMRDWDWTERQRELEAERQAADEAFLRQKYGDTKTKEQIREEVLAASYARTLATGDFGGLGMSTIKADVAVENAALEREKFEELKRKAAQADSAKDILGNRTLTEADKQARMHELFGIT